MAHWVDTYPHTVYASVLLLDNKIENWKVGQSKWDEPTYAKAFWKMDRMNDYTSQIKGWEVNSSEEHQEVFDELAPKWFGQWQLADDYKLASPYNKKKEKLHNKINPIDIKALEFRDDLIKLCNKYRCNISASNRDDGTMILDIYDKDNNWTSYYEMKDTYQNYALYKENNDYEVNCVMDEIIRKSFDKESGKMAGLNNIKVSCGILTNDSAKAELKLQELYCKYDKENVEIFIMSTDRKELRLNNGERFVWIKLNDGSRGYRCGKIVIDKNITLQELHDIVLPMCYACGRNDIEIF